MDWVDIAVVVLLLLAAVHGLRVGAVVQVLSLAGFVLGVTIGALLTDVVEPSVHSIASKTAVALALVFGIGALLGTTGRIVGTWGNLAARRHRLGGVDSAAGTGVAIVAALFAVWLVANELAQTQYTWLSSAIQRSGVVRAVDTVMPPLPAVFSHVQSFFGSSGFPPVFSELEPVPVHVATPTATEAQTLAASDVGSTVKILGQACGYLQEGSGFAVAPGMVVTNAHVVAGEPSTDVVANGQSYPATAVLFDPTFDLAVLRTSAPIGHTLTLDPETVAPSSQGAVIGYPENGPLTVGPAAVARQVTAQGRNIYNEGTVTRQVYEIDANVEPGNSGGPLVESGGEVVGVVFSRSTVYPDVGYALTSPGVLARVHQAEQRTAAVSTGTCVQG